MSTPRPKGLHGPFSSRDVGPRRANWEGSSIFQGLVADRLNVGSGVDTGIRAAELFVAPTHGRNMRASPLPYPGVSSTSRTFRPRAAGVNGF